MCVVYTSISSEHTKPIGFIWSIYSCKVGGINLIGRWPRHKHHLCAGPCARKRAACGYRLAHMHEPVHRVGLSCRAEPGERCTAVLFSSLLYSYRPVLFGPPETGKTRA